MIDGTDLADPGGARALEEEEEEEEKEEIDCFEFGDCVIVLDDVLSDFSSRCRC